MVRITPCASDSFSVRVPIVAMLWAARDPPAVAGAHALLTGVLAFTVSVMPPPSAIAFTKFAGAVLLSYAATVAPDAKTWFVTFTALPPMIVLGVDRSRAAAHGNRGRRR